MIKIAALKRAIPFVLIFFFLPSFTSGQVREQFDLTEEISWQELEMQVYDGIQSTRFPWTFAECGHGGTDEYRYPIFHLRIPLDLYGSLKLRLFPLKEIPLECPEDWKNVFESEYKHSASVKIHRNENTADLMIVPIRKSENQIWGLQSFRLEISFEADESSAERNGEYTSLSALSEGSIFRIPVPRSGIYQIDHSYLKGLGIELEELDPARISLFGREGGPLPESIMAARTDDLYELPILITGGGDGSFDEEDQVIFYAEGANIWTFDTLHHRYDYIRNVYDTHNFVFLKIGQKEGKRISTLADTDIPVSLSNQVDNLQIHELEKLNLLAQYDHTEGTGQQWYGESFFSTKEQDFAQFFDFEDMLLDEPVYLMARLAARSGSGSNFRVDLGERNFSVGINGVSLDSPELQYAREGVIEEDFMLNEKIDQLTISTTAYQAWLDRIITVTREKIIFKGEPITLRDHRLIGAEYPGFLVESSTGDFLAWDVTDPLEPVSRPLRQAGTELYSIGFPGGSRLRTFILFDPANVPVLTEQGIRIDNQNLHGIEKADMMIIHHKDFDGAAAKLASHRAAHNGYNVITVDIEQIFNEFSGGRQDPTAIRDFVKMIYERDPAFNYLLLMGDGSYDYRGIINTAANDNFVPVYETKQSLNPISGYVSDDYFALLSDNEGNELEGDLDIAVGRLPVRSAQQAGILVNKIIEYETSPQNDGDWQNRLALIADDEDYSRHLDQTEAVSQYVENNFTDFNLEKIYLDAFQQEVHPGGHRYPEVNKSINDNIFKGILAMTYIGHGGPSGFAQERILKLEDIYSWNNGNKLPLLITATCSFAGFDDPAINTAGEAAILKESGGVIGMFSTVRLVYSGENSILMNAVFREIFRREEGHYLKLGDVLKYAKNKTSNKDNKRKFFLFGDPAMQLALPEYKVYTSRINGLDIVEGQMLPDTLSALSMVSIEGFVGDRDGQIMTDFNGIVYPTVYDKTQIIETLENDPKSPKRSFQSQKRVLFKGAASVRDGRFSFEFIIPKDIDYSYGQGKISYYYSNGDNLDGAGSFSSFIIGGSSGEEIEDNQGPEITLYMNHTGFESGGITNNRPVLLAFLHDESGINISGTSIGHDLNGLLDGDILKQYKLNDFFQSETDDFKSGKITFPLDKLAPGHHTMYVEAWDVLNNKGEASIDFIVADEEDQVLQHLFNYPNPLTDHTRFYFEHTLPDTEMNVRIHIFDLRGKLVRSIRANAFTDGHKVDSIEWDGTDATGNRISNGIYVYNVQVTSNVLGITLESEYEKLVVIK